MTQLMTRAVGYLWLTSIVGYLVGFHFAIGSFVLGTIASRCVNDWLEARTQESENRATAVDSTSSMGEVEMSAVNGGGADAGESLALQDCVPAEAGDEGHADASALLCAFAVSIVANVCLFVLFALLYAFQLGDSVWSQPRTWLAVILGPPGAICRWQLSRLNGGTVLKRGRWAAFPLGTFVANIAAAAIDTALAGVLVSRGLSMSARAYDAVIAVLGGCMGSLSTTSTFVGEVHALLKTRGQESFAIFYAVGTILVALVIGVATYGWAEWTTGSDLVI